MTDEEALQRWPDLPPEERERRRKLSEAATERHQEIVDPETGRRAFGGPQPGSGRPRKKRFAERVAELAQEDEKQEKLVVKLFAHALDSDDERVSLRAIQEIGKIEIKEAELELRNRQYEDKDRDELMVFVAGLLGGLQARGELDLEALMRGQVNQPPQGRAYDADSTAEELDGGEPEQASA